MLTELGLLAILMGNYSEQHRFIPLNVFHDATVPGRGTVAGLHGHREVSAECQPVARAIRQQLHSEPPRSLHGSGAGEEIVSHTGRRLSEVDSAVLRRWA